MPAPKVKLRKIGDLHPDPQNARTHSEAQIARLAGLIERFGWTNPILADDLIRAGHGRLAAAQAIYSAGGRLYLAPGKSNGGAVLPPGTVPVIDCAGWSEEERTAYALADNQIALDAGWNTEILLSQLDELRAADFDIAEIGFDEEALAELSVSAGELAPTGGQAGAGRLAGEFLIAPFSVLNAREGWWMDRKRAWLALGIKSEVGRGENLLRMSDTVLEPDPEKRAAMQAGRGRKSGLGGVTMDALSSHPRYYEQKTAAEARVGRKLTPEEFERDHWVLPDSELSSGTSIFDPVLCELAYRWFSPPAGRVLDPFAGGSVRGIVAAALGRHYTGVDLRPEQIEANRAQWPGVAAKLPDLASADDHPEPAWHEGDAADVLARRGKADKLGRDFDFVFSCPPYGDLEVYSDDPADISTLAMDKFDKAYSAIIAKAVSRLADDRFACFVVGDYRDKHGIYANFVSKTIAAFEAAGARLYNEAILVTSVGSLPIRAAKQFRTTRKLGKTHQNILVFVKGDPRKATEICGAVDISAALSAIEPDHEPADPVPGGLAANQVKVSAAMARLEFIQCGPDCIERGCNGNCCDSSSHPGGCFVTVQDDELDRIELLAAQRGASIKDNLIVPRAGSKGCPFKTDGLCDLHVSGQKPWGCVASPFTLNSSGTLIIRNRYRLLPCFRNEGPKSPAYIAFAASLRQIFGDDESARIIAHLEAGGGDLIATIDPANKARLMRNDAIRKDAKASLGGEI